MTKLSKLPIADRLYKDPEKLEPEDKGAILDWLRATVARYRGLRAKLSVKKENGDDT